MRNLTLALVALFSFHSVAVAQRLSPVEGTLKPHHVAKEKRATSLVVRNQPVNGGLSQKLFVSAPSAEVADLIKKSLKRPDARSLKALSATIFDGFSGDEGPLAAFQGCTGNAQVTVLANEITYGATGPQVPTRLKYQIGTNEPVLMLDPVHSMIGTPIDVPMVPGEEVAFWGHSAYPDFENPYLVNFEKRSDDEFMAAILTNGNVLADVMAAKGAASIPYGMQQSLQFILESKMQDGVMNLASDELVILFELGATSSSSPAFDFNDLVLLVKTNCPNTTEVVLRDSIGPDNWTQGKFVVSASQEGTSHSFVTFAVTPSTAVTLKSVDVVLSSLGSEGVNFSAFDYEFRIWSGSNENAAHTAVLNSPLNGLNDVFFSPLLQQPPVFGQARSLSFGNPLVPSYLVSFNLEASSISLLPGTTYAITIAPRRNGGGSFGTMAMVGSSEVGSSDRKYWAPSNSAFLSTYPPFAGDSGRVGGRIIGIQQ